MKNTVKELSPRNKKSIYLTVSDCLDNGMNKAETAKAVCKKMLSMGIVENSGSHNSMLAVALAFYTFGKAKKEGASVEKMFSQYAAWKLLTMDKLQDYGAFGDFFEVCLRLYCKPMTLWHMADLHVKHGYTADITIRGTCFEIGNNGKTFAESEKDNPFVGHYEKICYGVFPKEEQLDYMKKIASGEIENTLKELAENSYIFSKEQFYDCLVNKCGRASMFQYKPCAGHWQVIYNDSKCNLFTQMVNKEKVTSLKEYLNK